MSFTGRDYRHFIRAGVTLGVDVNEGQARVAISFTSRHENGWYSRPSGRNHINLRFDVDDSTLRSMGIERNVYQFPYDGRKPRIEILNELTKLLSEDLKLREKSKRYAGSTLQMKQTLYSFAAQQRKQTSKV